MTDTASDNGHEVQPESKVATRLRLRPAVIIVVIYFVLLSFAFVTSTIIGNAVGIIGGPILSTLLLAAWWIFFSRVPWSHRLIGFALYAAVVAWIALSQPRYGERLLFIALPVLNVGIVVAFALAASGSWRMQRVAAIAVMVVCAIAFPLFRVKDVASNLTPILTTRWAPTNEELLAAETHAPKPGARAQLPVQLGTEDWPAFRGPLRDGIVRDVAFALNWNETKPRELWRKRVGLGYSSFAAVGDYVFTQEQRQDDEVVVCYRADTGEEIWINAINARFDESTGAGPRATPTFESGRLYTQGALGMLQCLDAATGQTIWQTDIAKDTGRNVPQWGFASSPLVTDKHVVLFVGAGEGKGVVAYDKATGARAWCSGNGKDGYSSAHLAPINGVNQIIVTSDIGVEAFTPDTGAVLWAHTWPTKMNPRVVQPTIVDGNAVLLGTAEGKGTRYLQVALNNDTWDVQEKWTIRTFRPYFNDYVMHKGFCYGFDGDMLVCIDAHTGDRKWKGSRYGGQVLLASAVDALVILGEKGELVLVRATPDAFEEIANFQALEGKTWNHPVIANGRLFLRNADEAVCYELPAASTAPVPAPAPTA